jgi:hypothetical protein
MNAVLLAAEILKSLKADDGKDVSDVDGSRTDSSLGDRSDDGHDEPRPQSVVHDVRGRGCSTPPIDLEREREGDA